MIRRLGLAVCLLASLSPLPAAAQEMFAGAYVHGVGTPFTFDTGESGADIAVGYRFARIEGLGLIGRPAPYVIASVNTRGDTSFAAAGLSWRVGKGPFYLRPAVGLAVHDGPAFRLERGTNRRTDLGSRVLFEPELALGWRAGERLSLEASWMHVSHARLFNREQNPGIDMMGLRLNWRLGRDE